VSLAGMRVTSLHILDVSLAGIKACILFYRRASYSTGVHLILQACIL
jgi:hypothetical protein